MDRARRRPLQQAAAADDRPVRRDAAVVRTRRARLLGQPAAVGALLGRPRRRGDGRVRQPGASGIRRRDGPVRGHEQRGEPEQRGDDVLAGLRPRARRSARHHRRLRLGVPRRRALLHRRARRPRDDAVVRAPPVTGAEAGQGSGPRGPALRPQRSRPLGPAGDDGHRRHPRLQLPDRLPVVRHPQHRRHGHHVHAAAVDGERRRSVRCARHGPAQVDRRAHGLADGDRLRRRRWR